MNIPQPIKQLEPTLFELLNIRQRTRNEIMKMGVSVLPDDSWTLYPDIINYINTEITAIMEGSY